MEDDTPSTEKGSNGERKNKKCKIYIPHVGIFLAILGSLFYSLNAVFAKLLTIPPVQVALSRVVIQYCIVIPFALGIDIKKVDQIIGEREIRVTFWIRGLAGALSDLFYYLSIKNLSAGNAVTLSFTDIIFVPIMGRIVYKEALTIFDATFSLIAFCGVILIAKPSFLFSHVASDSSENAIGVFYAVMAALCASTAYITVRKLGKRVHFWHSVLSYTMVGIVGNLILALATEEFHYPCLSEVFFVFLMALSAFFGTVTLTIALQNERAGTVTVLMSLQIIIVYLIQVLILHDIPSPLSLVGSGLIFSTSFLIGIRKIVNDRKRRKSVAKELD